MEKLATEQEKDFEIFLGFSFNVSEAKTKVSDSVSCSILPPTLILLGIRQTVLCTFHRKHLFPHFYPLKLL